MPLGICGKGHKGILCGECITGYKLKAEFVCDQCLDKNSNIIQVVLVGVAALVVVTLFVRSSMKRLS
jgi:hypothetical protein